MADSRPKLIAKKYAELAAALPGIETTWHYEPEDLGKLPAVSMLFRRIEQDKVETGPQTRNAWSWAVTLTIPIGSRVAGSDLEAAQDALYDLVPALLQITRQHPDLDFVCDRATIEDSGEDPVVDEDNSIVTKVLELRATTEET